MDRHDVTQLAKGLGFLSPWLFGFCVFTMLPILLSLYYSLCDFSTLPGQPPLFVGLDNYRDLMHDAVFWRALLNTGYYALLAIPCGLLVSLGLALLLNIKVPGQAIFRTVIFLPSLVPIVASAMIWMWLLNARLGLLNVMLGKIGIAGPSWLADPRWAMPSLVIMSLWSLGYTVVIYLAGLQDVPRELYEAADLDGAGAWSRLLNVTLPVMSPVIFFNLIMALIGVVGVLDAPYIVTQGGPARATYFISMYIRDSAFLFIKMGYASAMAWIMLLLVLVLTAAAFWSSRRWVHYGGK